MSWCSLEEKNLSLVKCKEVTQTPLSHYSEVFKTVIKSDMQKSVEFSICFQACSNHKSCEAELEISLRMPRNKKKFTLVRVESDGMLESDELARVSVLGCL